MVCKGLVYRQKLRNGREAIICVDPKSGRFVGRVVQKTKAGKRRVNRRVVPKRRRRH